jgi:hypothetical protein
MTLLCRASVNLNDDFPQQLEIEWLWQEIFYSVPLRLFWQPIYRRDEDDGQSWVGRPSLAGIGRSYPIIFLCKFAHNNPPATTIITMADER